MPRFQVTRSVVVHAPVDSVFDKLADYQTWTTWSPWLISEPDAKVTVSTPSNTLGATYAWSGEVTGAGQLQHKKLEPGSLIEDDLNFIKPFKSYAKVVFELSPVAEGTKVIWSMDSSLPWFLFWMVPMMKTFIGMDYARGLAMFKEWLETGVIRSQVNVAGVEQTQAFRMAGIAGSSSVDQVGSAMEKTFAQAESEFKRAGIRIDGEMVSVYTKFRIKEGIFDYISGYIIPANVEIPSNSRLKTWSLPTEKVFRVQHVGSYRHLGNGWSVANQLVRHKKLKQSRCGTYEIYRTVPPTPEQELVTDIYLPLK